LIIADGINDVAGELALFRYTGATEVVCVLAERRKPPGNDLCFSCLRLVHVDHRWRHQRRCRRACALPLQEGGNVENRV